MIRPVSRLRTGLIQISPSCWTIYHSFETILEMGTVNWIGLQIQCSIQIHCFNNIQSDMKYVFEKYLIAYGSSGSNGWAQVKRERTKSKERLLRTILFDSGHLQHERERPEMKRKCMNNDKAQRKEPGTGPWVVAQICKASKLALCINRNRRLRLSPRSPCPGVVCRLLKTPRTQLKKQAKMTQYWYLS